MRDVKNLVQKLCPMSKSVLSLSHLSLARSACKTKVYCVRTYNIMPLSYNCAFIFPALLEPE